MGKAPSNSFQLTEDEIKNTINNLKDNKAIQKDEIPTKFLKYANDIIAPVRSKMYNKCIEQGIYPKCLKVAQVIPRIQSMNV